jgi:Na+/H+ antiporter NhaD/arsenite permease-like protein
MYGIIDTIILKRENVAEFGGLLPPQGSSPIDVAVPLMAMSNAGALKNVAIEEAAAASEAVNAAAAAVAADPANNRDVLRKPLIQVDGWFNVILMLLVVVLVACTGTLQKVEAFKILNVSVHVKNLIRDVGLFVLSGVALVRFFRTKRTDDEKKHVSWAPINEVTRFFLAIFITMAPVAAMLKGGHEFFAPISRALANSDHPAFLYFWFVSPFSAFLDNAPTYLIFFKMAGGDAQFLMNEGAKILVAISAGAVFMGAMTYIGNAPNFMVRTIAEQYGVKMPNFLGYMALASLILLPLFLVLCLIFLY